MRIAVVSDIHGNLTALEAVIADLRSTRPDLVVQGGDLAASGHRPAEVIDRVRDLGWPGVKGNTDEMLWDREPARAFASETPQLTRLVSVLVSSVAPATTELIGPVRLAWLRRLPAEYRVGGMALVHASPTDLWKAPMPDSDAQTLTTTYEALSSSTVVYGHIHRPYVRTLPRITIANSGSVGLPYDGDPRAAYLLIDDDHVQVRRVEYDIDAEIRSLLASAYPHASWFASILRGGRYVPPPEDHRSP